MKRQRPIPAALHEGTGFPTGKVGISDQNAEHQGGGQLTDLLSRWDLDPKYREEFLLCIEGQNIQETYVLQGLILIFP